MALRFVVKQSVFPCLRAPAWPLPVQGSLSGCRYLSRSLKPVIVDPERPARPLSPWLRFLGELRLQRDAGSNNKEFFSVASAKWKMLPPPEKQKYQEPYETERKAYGEKVRAYVDSGKKDAWARDPARPKAPLTAYIRFANDFRKNNPDVKMTECSKLSGTAWKGLPPQMKLPYEQEYAAEKERYAKEFEEYQKSGKEDQWKQKVGIAAAEQAKKEKADKVKAAGQAKNAKRAAGMAAVVAKKARSVAAEKELAAKLKDKELSTKAKAKQLKEKVKAKLLKEKVKATQLKEKDRALKLKEKERTLKQKEKDGVLKLKLKERALKETTLQTHIG